MTNLQMIERLCGLLDEALGIIKEQAALLAMHGIETEAGKLEADRQKLLADVEKEGWTA